MAVLLATNAITTLRCQYIFHTSNEKVWNYVRRFDEVSWTRISEHKHFSPWESHADTLIFKEYSRFCEENDTPYYPIRLAREKTQLQRVCRASQGRA